jgi:hypothetical protein
VSTTSRTVTVLAAFRTHFVDFALNLAVGQRRSPRTLLVALSKYMIKSLGKESVQGAFDDLQEEAGPPIRGFAPGIFGTVRVTIITIKINRRRTANQGSEPPNYKENQHPNSKLLW